MSLPATVPQPEIAALRMAWAKDPRDVGLGMYRPSTSEIHIGSYDATGRIGHDGLQAFLGVPDSERPEWRGFIVSSTGLAINNSGLNSPDGGVRMRADYFAQVRMR
jgi:hypothetical protein